MATVTLLPNAQEASVPSWTIGGGAATYWGALSDASDATYVENTGGLDGFGVSFATFTLPALAQVRQIAFKARMQFPSYPSGSTDTVRFYEASTVGSVVGGPGWRGLDDIRADLDFGDALIRYHTIWTGTSPDGSLGPVYTQALIDNRAMKVYRIQPTGTIPFRIMRFELLFTYNEAPVVSAVAASPMTSSRPTVTWTYLDPEGDNQERRRIKVFSAAQYGIGGFNPDTSPHTWDSGEVYAATQTATVGADLQNGVTYKAYVKASDVGSGGRYSAWALSSTFTIALTPPPAPTLAITMQPTSARVQLVATHGTYAPAVQRFIIQRSVDAGVTWVTVRGADETLPTAGSVLTMWDYEVPRGVVVRYRVQTVADPAGGRVASAWSAEHTGTLTTTGWWLKDPADPTRNTVIHVESFPFSQKEPQTVYEPLGRANSVVVGDGVKGIEGAMTLWAKTKAEYDALVLILSAARSLWLEDVLGRTWYVKIGASHEYEIIRALPAAGETTPIRYFHRVGLPFVEVAAPSNA
jgi:hypothetical protein